jgi:hypothetical protein
MPRTTAFPSAIGTRMASAFLDHSVVRLGSDGPARRAASFPGAGVVHLVVWPMLMFNYLHDGMHIENFWMTRVPILKSWFLNARRLHDIHHRSLNSKGFMDTNFGIGFYFFFTGSSGPWQSGIARSIGRGIKRPFWRYGLGETELLSRRHNSRALFRKDSGGKAASHGA